MFPILKLDGIVVPVYHLNQYIAFYCDYFYQQTGIKYSLRGARPTSGANGGCWIISLFDASNIYSWSASASISFKTLLL